MASVLRFILMLFGILIMGFGVVITPLPGPFGVPVIMLGLIMVLRSSTWFKRQFLRLVRRYPQLLYPLRKMLRPRAQIIGILYSQMLKLERYTLPSAFRPLRKIRQFFRGRHHKKTAYCMAVF